MKRTVAQSIEQSDDNRQVGGLSPSRPTKPRIYYAVWEEEGEDYRSGAISSDSGGNAHWEDNQFRVVEYSAYKFVCEALKLALSFAPKGPVPEGLDPTFYHTLNYKDEVDLQKRIDAARALVE